MGRRSLGIAGDITRPDQIVQVVEDAIKTFGRVDILVNNVGGMSMTPKEPDSGPLGKIMAAWDTSYEQNLRATVLMCEAIAPYFSEQKSGKIVNISSVAGRPGFPAMDAYGSMKACLIRYTQSLADRLGPSNINFHLVFLGTIHTDFRKPTAARVPEHLPSYKAMTPK